MLKRQILALVAGGFAVLSGLTLVTGRLGPLSTLAQTGDECATPTTDSPFMGTSDPGAPYDLRFIDEVLAMMQRMMGRC